MKQKTSHESLQEVHSSVDTRNRKSTWRRLLSFLGPAYLVSVGYMDPGNWATDIEGGSKFGYALIWVLVMSNLMALLLQSLSARLGIVAGMDLAQASRAHYPKKVNFFLWFFAEIAIAATDLAEVIGMAIGLQLLFGLPLLVGVGISIFDTFLLLALQRYGIQKLEAFIIGLISVIGIAFVVQLYYAKPEMSGIINGLVPSMPDNTALYIAIGIIGATVMPHNLYLHSSLVQTRKFDFTAKGIREAIKFNVIDSAIALNLALFVNAAILILAASTFFKNGMHDMNSIQDAHLMLDDVLGNKLAPTLFAIALIAAGQSSTLTGTLSGQIVMEGYLNIRMQPWARRLITRLLAVIPAVIVILVSGEDQTDELLVFSQVILSLQLGFAVIPLIHFTSNKKLMGEFAAPLKLIIPAWISAVIIVSLNVKLVAANVAEWFNTSEHPVMLAIIIIPPIALAAFLLLWVTLQPIIQKGLQGRTTEPHHLLERIKIKSRDDLKRIAVCVDFSTSDEDALSHAFKQGGKSATYILLHITETAGARVMKGEVDDYETSFDKQALQQYKDELTSQGYSIETKLGYGNPKEAIPQLAEDSDCEMLVMGAHGHNWWHDLLLGTTVESVRHKIKVPLLVVNKTKK